MLDSGNGAWGSTRLSNQFPRNGSHAPSSSMRARRDSVKNVQWAQPGGTVGASAHNSPVLGCGSRPESFKSSARHRSPFESQNASDLLHSS